VVEIGFRPIHTCGRVQTIFVVGPTAVGKSAVALELARRIDAEIVSADSMQVYRGMDIGTAKPSAEERRSVRHHLIDICEVGEVFDVKRFVELAKGIIEEIRGRGKEVLVVGGTGLYVRALQHGLFEGPPRDPQVRAKLELMSADTLFEELQRVDARTAGQIDRHNPRRLVRALEVFYLTGKPISEMQTQWAAESQGDGILLCLNRERDDLYQRIEQRIDEQIAAEWVDEVKRLLERGLDRNPSAMQAAGYRELVAYTRGESTLAGAVTLIKARTRQLARRQLTWFRREAGLNWLEIGRAEPPQETASRGLEILEREKAKHVEDA
jgi:tRNA dimethylallyltransferase